MGTRAGSRRRLARARVALAPRIADCAVALFRFPFAPAQTALLDVVRQSHIVAGAAVGVAAGLVFSLRALRRK